MKKSSIHLCLGFRKKIPPKSLEDVDKVQKEAEILGYHVKSYSSIEDIDRVARYRNDYLITTCAHLCHLNPDFYKIGKDTPYLQEPYKAGRKLLAVSDIVENAVSFSGHYVKSLELKGLVKPAPLELKRLQGLPLYEESLLLVSPPYDIASEVRFFVLNQEILAHTPYYGRANARQMDYARSYVQAYLQSSPKRSTVVDVAILKDDTVIILEENPPWAAATYDLPLSDLVESLKISYLPKP